MQGTRLGLNVKYVEQCSKKSEKNEFHSSENVWIASDTNRLQYVLV